MGNILAKFAAAYHTLGVDWHNEFHVAVCGPAGTGKSSVINCILGLRNGAPGSAPVGITETTHEHKKYSHPRLPYVKVWDIPGAGTADHPASTYYVDELLYGFHMIVIVSAGRIHEVVNDIVRRNSGLWVKMCLIWNKADVDLESLMDSGARSRADAEVAKTALKTTMEHDFAAKGLIGFPLYIVSARNWAKRCRGSAAEQFDEDS
ncbi:immunity-related GTPases-like protein [Hyaloraphidium curvatum]|nr:immunity-related GTPases-like protein [Hyaloraphidium curvatum]